MQHPWIVRYAIHLCFAIVCCIFSSCGPHLSKYLLVFVLATLLLQDINKYFGAVHSNNFEE